MLRALLVKEFWHLKTRKDLFFAVGFTIALLLLIIIVTAFTASRYLTPLTRAIALKQVREHPEVFGLSSADVERMGDYAVVFATFVAQLTPEIALLSAVVAYMTVVSSFMLEKSYRTMEVLLAMPLRLEDIVLAKLLCGALMAMLCWALMVLLNLLTLEWLSVTYLGKLWAPTWFYVCASFLVPLSLVALSLALAVFAGLRGSELLAKILIVPVLFGPLIPLLAQIFVSLADVSVLYTFMGVASLAASLAMAAYSRRMMNRLSFVTNY